jgi:hypothetical protein
MRQTTRAKFIYSAGPPARLFEPELLHVHRRRGILDTHLPSLVKPEAEALEPSVPGPLENLLAQQAVPADSTAFLCSQSTLDPFDHLMARL